LHPQELGHSLTAREANMPTLVSLVPGQHTRNVAGIVEGNRITETIFTGSREFIMLVGLGDNFSKP
jgi:hypothetical protein